MENLAIYLIKSSTLLLFFFSTYYFLLKKETFFTTNRWFLIVGIFCSALLPLLTFQKIVVVEPVVSTMQFMNTETTSTTITNIATLEENAFSWELLLIVLYGLGVFFFLSKLIIEFYSLKKIINSNNKKRADGCEFIEVNQLITPFSFFNKIVYNPSLFQTEELKNIIEHEKIHAKQLHSLDVLIARMYCILIWWNPLVWIYKKAMVQNLEFIADQKALAKAVDKKSYLLTLIKITTAENPVAITNHFYQSLIKKRIVMLHTNQSKKHHSWKYFIVLPALVFFMLTYQIDVVAQEKATTKTVVETVTTKFEMTIDASSPDKDLDDAAGILKKEFGVTAKFKKISRNKKREIRKLSVTLSDKKGTTKVYDVSDSEAIKPFTIFVNTDENGQQTFGFGAPKENQHLKNHFDALERSQNNSQPKQVAVIAYEKDGKSMIKSTPESEITIAEIEVKDKTDFLKNKLIVVDDKVISEEDYYKIDANSIKSVKLEKRKKDTDARFEALFKKYGVLASNGILDITTNAADKSIEKENSGWGMDYKATSPENNIVHIKESKDVDYKKAFISLNGKEISSSEMEKIKPSSIETVTTINGGDNSKLASKYGQRAKYGAILIETFGYKEAIPKEQIEETGKNFKIGAESEGFTIHKRSQKSDFEFYQKHLNQIGVNAKISGIERNAAGFITAIKIKLVDKERNHKVSENWTTSRNPNGIPDISIGRKNGKIVLKAN